MAPTFDIRNLRNIGIIAHIDAGKTTTTERVLYYTGESHKMGSVDDGTTVTDFDPREQESGITIRAAAITCRWRPKGIRINLIDTPGHVDFTAEVQRSLRVLDGGVVVFSGMEGVEAQSETVWRQADQYKVPRICFINKLDRIGADFARVYDEITDRLHAKPLPLQIPIGREKDFRGVVDLVAGKACRFDERTLGKDVQVEDIPVELEDEAALWRERLIELLGEVDDVIAEAYLEEREIDEQTLKAAIRRATIEQGMTPILCGSSLKYIGVQPLLDAVADYLPSPLDVPPVVGENLAKEREETRPPNDAAPFCGLLFKIQADQHDELGFMRIYSGTLKPSTRVLNAGKNKKENLTRLWHIQADRRTKVDLARSGDIVGVVGLKDSVTGDTLCDPKAPIVLEKISFPETVISMSIEPEASSDKDKLASVLALLQKEDPTFRVRQSSETGEMLISGMGELHLEVVVERIARGFHVKVRTGKPRVSYRETIRAPARATGVCHRQMASGSWFAEVTIQLEPLRSNSEDAPFRFVDQCPPDTIPAEFLSVIEEELSDECQSGGLAGYPLADIQATLLDAKYREGESTPEACRFAVAHAVRQALSAGAIDILEPIMRLEVVSPEDYLGEINSDLMARRAMIESMGMRGDLRVISARAPLREMFGYSTKLRSLSQGRATYSMEPHAYESLPESLRKSML